MSLDKIKNTLIFSSNLDSETKQLNLVNEIISNTDVSSLETANTDSLNSYTILEQEYNIDADFVEDDVPTNARINPSELNKIKYTSVYTTGVTDDEKTKNLNLVSEIYQDVVEGVVPRDLSPYGFSGFDITTGDDDTTGFDKLNFSANSGFIVERDPNTKATLNINHNGFSKISADNELLNAELADTLYLVGDGISFETSVDEFNRKFLTIKNSHQTISSMEDVEITDPLSTDEILMQKNGVFKNIASQEVRPAIIYGGEF